MTKRDVHDLTSKIHELLSAERFIEAKEILITKLKASKIDTADDLLYLAEIAGLLIDLGTESYDKESIELGLQILEKNKEPILSVVKEMSLDYCIANGKHGLYKIHLRDSSTMPSPEIIKEFLAEPKNYYYKAFKTLDLNNLDDIGFQILTNLGNNLDHAGRAVEAIQLFDIVLMQNPSFPQAQGSKADAIRFWMLISKAPQSIALYAAMYRNFRASLNSTDTPPHIHRLSNEWLQVIKDKIEFLGYSIDDLESEFLLSLREKSQHSPYRIFCLNNFLTLNEHSIYCHCVAAAKDNLSIGYDGPYLKGKKAPKMELALNRMKAEFALARKLYYESTLELDIPQQDEMVYIELYDGEAIGLASEKLRTSFRMCFGIFDRIAHALCYFFDLKQSKNENIYFEKFWHHPQKTDRWQKINQISNIHVTALYSIACDLNQGGEFGHYKTWRNWLEHEILILLDNEKKIDLLKVLEDDSFLNSRTIEVFQKEALHLLRLCRAAIFSFTYAIRVELLIDEKEDDRPSIKLSPKNSSGA